MDKIILQFSTTPLWQSGVIRLATRSKFSHVDAVIPAGVLNTPEPYGLLGASDPGGVMIRPPNYHDFKIRRRMTLKTTRSEQPAQFAKVLSTKLGDRFDHEALYRVFDPNLSDWQIDASWICVEIITWALLEIGYWDYEPYPVQMNLRNVTPEDLIKWLRGRYDPKEWNQEVIT